MNVNNLGQNRKSGTYILNVSMNIIPDSFWSPDLLIPAQEFGLIELFADPCPCLLWLLRPVVKLKKEWDKIDQYVYK